MPVIQTVSSALSNINSKSLLSICNRSRCVWQILVKFISKIFNEDRIIGSR
jgi:hypothetical protein